MDYTNRVFNFSAGPSVLPLEVLKEAQEQLLSYHGCGQSVMEMSHRSKEFEGIITEAEADLRDLISIPDNYKVLFLQGGGHLQFSMVPINLMTGSGKSDYIVTGTWAKKAAAEAKKFGDVRVVADSSDKNFTYIPKVSREDFRADADYVYICTNNTIFGSHFPYVPDTGDIPLVADMSSCFLSEEIDVSKYGLIWAGAQKNVAPAGVTIVIVREDLIGKAPENTPLYLDYKIHADKGSMYNTPPCWSIYIAGLVFKYLKSKGGVKAMHDLDVKKAAMLYDCIDSSDGFYTAPVAKEDRSLMNVVFVTGNPELDAKFVAEARAEGMVNLKGHRSVGGLRASIFNAMPIEGVEALVDFMERFRKANR